MHAGYVGAHLITVGIHSYFRPWYFDGSVVYYGEFEYTQKAAVEAADRMKAAMLSKAK